MFVGPKKEKNVLRTKKKRGISLQGDTYMKSFSGKLKALMHH
jgi:hypothetical protein